MEAVLFKRLEGVRKRPEMAFKPGALLMAAYGDNWCADSLQISKTLLNCRSRISVGRQIPFGTGPSTLMAGVESPVSTRSSFAAAGARHRSGKSDYCSDRGRAGLCEGSLVGRSSNTQGLWLMQVRPVQVHAGSCGRPSSGRRRLPRR